jgi:hypothetical protein
MRNPAKDGCTNAKKNSGILARPGSLVVAVLSRSSSLRMMVEGSVAFERAPAQMSSMVHVTPLVLESMCNLVSFWGRLQFGHERIVAQLKAGIQTSLNRFS